MPRAIDTHYCRHNGKTIQELRRETMFRTNLKSHVGLTVLLAALVCLCGTQAVAQIPEDPDPPEAPVTGTPPFIADLVDQTELTPEQVDQMRTGGAGWGNIMIATRLAERIAANSSEPDTLTFDEALTLVLDARAQGKGFGQIAHEHDLKVGSVLEGEDSPNGSSQPRFISDLVEKTELTQEQADQMRSDGAGWGNIMISTRLAERIAADSVEPDKLTFAEALDDVLAARADDMGFGEIAHEHDLKVGPLVSGGKKGLSTAAGSPAPEGTLAGSPAGIGRAGKPKKQNMFGRLFGMFRSGRSVRGGKPPKPERPNKFEKPERPARPEKIEKPERPPKPEKPEKPERGPRR
jgi:hypothetical protein